MPAPDLPAHLKIIKYRLERLWPSIRKGDSEEHRQLVGAMYDTITLAERLYYFPPAETEDDWDQWRHDVIRPMSLCINTAELLLTDKEHPLDDEQRELVQTVFDEAMTLSGLIDDMYAQRA